MLYKWRWVIAILVTSAVVAFFGLVVWFLMALQPAAPGAKQALSYHLESGTSVDDIAQQLEAADIIKSAPAFTLFVSINGLRSELKAGTYELNPSRSTNAIAHQLAEGRIAVNTLRIPEGADISKIRELAGDKGISPDQFNAALKLTYPNAFLAKRPAGSTSLEGYLFPDSYQITKPPNSQAVVRLMLDNFVAKVEKTDIAASFTAQGLSFHEGLTLASIVEKEVSNPTDQPIVAGIFLNRLKAGQRLESDITVTYAAKLLGKPFDLSLDSPYNTYRSSGLPPGPVCNPGLTTLQAVAHPQKTDYLYFLADKQGKTHYAKTLEAHTRNIKLYLSN